MRVRLLDLAAQHAEIYPRLLQRLESVLRSGTFILGPEVQRFEREACDFLGVKHAIGVSCGSDALVVALAALGIGAGDEVITTPFSFVATVEAILRVGARPVFADLGVDSFELDPVCVERAITPRSRAILSVPLYGASQITAQLTQLAQTEGLPLLEDAAQAFGARLDGRALGTFGALGCYSFHPAKPLGALGDAGLLVTNDARLAARCARLRVHGSGSKYAHDELGGNYRLDQLQAAVLSEQLPLLPEWLAARRRHARRYSEALSGLPDLRLPTHVLECEPSFAQFTLRVRAERRDALRDFLELHGIESAVHYPLPLHRQAMLMQRGLGSPLGTFPESERTAQEVLSLPVHPALTEAELSLVIETTRRFFDGSRS